MKKFLFDNQENLLIVFDKEQMEFSSAASKWWGRNLTFFFTEVDHITQEIYSVSSNPPTTIGGTFTRNSKLH